jgi:hypothetical protein
MILVFLWLHRTIRDVTIIINMLIFKYKLKKSAKRRDFLRRKTHPSLPYVVQYEPALLDFRVSVFVNPATGRLALVERRIHVLRSVAVEVIGLKGAVTVRKHAGREGVRAASTSASSGTAGGLKA